MPSAAAAAHLQCTSKRGTLIAIFRALKQRERTYRIVSYPNNIYDIFTTSPTYVGAIDDKNIFYVFLIFHKKPVFFYSCNVLFYF